jgi:hypothetical protein
MHWSMTRFADDWMYKWLYWNLTLDLQLSGLAAKGIGSPLDWHSTGLKANWIES